MLRARFQARRQAGRRIRDPVIEFLTGHAGPSRGSDRAKRAPERARGPQFRSKRQGSRRPGQPITLGRHRYGDRLCGGRALKLAKAFGFRPPGAGSPIPSPHEMSIVSNGSPNDTMFSAVPPRVPPPATGLQGVLEATREPTPLAAFCCWQGFCCSRPAMCWRRWPRIKA